MAGVSSGFEPFFRDVSINPNIIPLEETSKDEATRTKYLVIDSRDRDVAKYNINKYEIPLNEHFENVVSIELVSTKLPFTDNTEPYIVMKISGMDIIQSNNQITNRATAIIYENPDATNINFQDTVRKKFNPPRPISNFKVSFYKYNGELYDFNLNNEHSIVLKITTLKQGRRV